MLEHVLGELRREELKLEVDHVAPLTGMLELFAFIHAHFGSHPELIPLLSGENLLRARFLRRSSKAPIVASPLIELIARLLARGVKEGVFRAGIDPLQLYVMMVALSYFHRSNAHTLSVLFRTDLLEPPGKLSKSGTPIRCWRVFWNAARLVRRSERALSRARGARLK